MDAIKRAYLELHLAVFLFGFTGILGKLISLNELVLVWWRMFFTSISFLFFLKIIIKSLRKTNVKFVGYLAFIGVLVAIHWVCFFGSIKYSNVSVALVCFATTTFFTSLLEPLLLKSRFNIYELLLGLLLIPGMYLVVNGIEIEMLIGVVLGVLGALLASVFSILNKGIIHRMDSISITAIELSSGWLFLCLILPFYLNWFPEALFLPNGWSDIGYLLVLSLVCTTFAYVLSLGVLKHISAFVVNLTISLEPIYAIVLAWLLFQENEELNPQFYWGVAIIMAAVFLHPVVNKFLKRRQLKTVGKQVAEL